ncbi:FAD dependent oxidoreductase [Polychaeton citri CBS 116435]|uniref:L-2-hydroxyglutarate dehydrogenase, mitochondrial n=1 Tax=Polychaeton citri CBS 116435 TaxID=1314669 RepID=A0A9P4QAN8_9PEZI|nr:FAD dependent oxidoreductase [Polychaeton citri CBS 116435]
MLPTRNFRAIARHCIRTFSTSTPRQADFTHAVIGAGAVGLAIARRLQEVEGASVVLIERHGIVGSETSSRNSEVIHAGIYYGAETLKTRLCVEGKQRMYGYCSKRDVPHRNCGKWIVAQNDEQMEALRKVHEHSRAIGVPVHFLAKDEASGREPDVRAEAGILESPTTGIVDSHTYMQALLADFEEAGGDTALGSAVTRIDAPMNGDGDWRIFTTTLGQPSVPTGQEEGSEDDACITASTLVNSAGLYACAINNLVLPPERHRTLYYAKGSYFSYSKSTPRPSTLVYPAPIPGHGGLGTHLTLDIAGRIRFGPDVEWVDSPDDLAPTGSPERFQAALEDIKAYLPGIDVDAVDLDYAGIRPKLASQSSVTSGQGFNDFYIKREDGYNGFVNLLGIESPGLTSSLAIAEEVHRILYT